MSAVGFEGHIWEELFGKLFRPRDAEDRVKMVRWLSIVYGAVGIVLVYLSYRFLLGTGRLSTAFFIYTFLIGGIAILGSTVGLHNRSEWARKTAMAEAIGLCFTGVLIPVFLPVFLFLKAEETKLVFHHPVHSPLSKVY